MGRHQVGDSPGCRAEIAELAAVAVVVLVEGSLGRRAKLYGILRHRLWTLSYRLTLGRAGPGRVWICR